MSWVRIDDSAPNHPKFLAAGYQAWALWTAGLCYCNAHLTDGKIPKEAVRGLLVTMTASRNVLARAVHALCTPGARSRHARGTPGAPDAAPLWHDCGTYYQVHDYEQFQASKGDVDQRRQQDRERQRRWRQAKEEDTSRRDKQRDTESRHAVTNGAPSHPITTTPPVVPLAGAKGTNAHLGANGRKPRRLTGLAKENAAMEEERRRSGEERAAAPPPDLETYRGWVLSSARLHHADSFLPLIASAGSLGELEKLRDQIEPDGD